MAQQLSPSAHEAKDGRRLATTKQQAKQLAKNLFCLMLFKEDEKK